MQMYDKVEQWELTILDADTGAKSLCSLCIGDIDGDGEAEIVTGGEGLLNWYRPGTFGKGTIAQGSFHIGAVLEDIDGDGRLELAVSQRDANSDHWDLVIFKPGRTLDEPWRRYVIDTSCNGPAHDIIFADLDDDGMLEIIALASYCEVPGIFAYKHQGDPYGKWLKHAVMTGYFTEGLLAADLNADGRLELICGPDWFISPSDGPYAGAWERRVFAPDHREMCRTGAVDITGNGRPDIVLVDSEYEDGRLSWFENRLLENPEHPWQEHKIDEGLVFAHSFSCRLEKRGSEIHIFVGEMTQGGWNAPYNADARLLEYISADRGQTWVKNLIYRGEGTHQAMMYDIDGDGDPEVVGKDWAEHWSNPKVQIWKRNNAGMNNLNFRHVFVDRDKPSTGTDILAVDVDGDGLEDIICASWWYRNPQWVRYALPEDYQAINAFDVDGDGRKEIIAFKMKPHNKELWYYADHRFTSEFYWLKPVDPINGGWEIYPIGTGAGDWAHGTAAGPLLPGGKMAFIAAYHSAQSRGHLPEIFIMPDDPASMLWEKRILMDIPYGEEFVLCDINDDGMLDILAGEHWLENIGNGNFKTHRFAEGFKAARVCAADMNGDGLPDIVLGEEALDFEKRVTPFSRLVWFENPGKNQDGLWRMHLIDTVRCPHSLSVADLDGDGQPEVICGEHDPFRPYRSRCRLMVYKKAEPSGKVWTCRIIDGRFEHHDGAKVIRLASGSCGIISHGWQDSIYVHLWEPVLKG